ncbi:MAG: carboxylating nicotinate-nucleotide diphosphorylase [Verrucomicrobiota bacterium]|nr:carboxylating nicotinate-nucleotide diphosphorylase [Verrucomicrobiota bacterium]
MKRLASEEISRVLNIAFAEDFGAGDATTRATIGKNLKIKTNMSAREPLVVAGLDLARAAFKKLSPQIKIRALVSDGQRVNKGKVLLQIQGSASAILTAERVALNFVQRLSGIATLAAKFVKAVAGINVKILDTRKTTPGLRLLEKYAVACGGGKNHRFGLHDMILIKDNHLATLKNEFPNAIAAAVQRARKKYPRLKIEVEVDTLDQVKQAVKAGADIILLDNMSLKELRSAVKMIARKSKTEASGNVNLKTVRAMAETGVDFISVGAITHSAPAVDIGLDFEF